MSAPSSSTAASPAPQTLATARLPARVRRILEHLLTAASDELERHLSTTLTEFEQQLFRLADHARNPGIESGHLQTLRTLRLNRADMLPRFMAGLEASLACLGNHVTKTEGTNENDSSAFGFSNLSLIEHTEFNEDGVLREIAVRQESQSRLTLHLLGQRFGVLAGAPAFDAEHLPIGPQSLCRIMRDAAQSLQISVEARLLLYRAFEQKVMMHYPHLVEMLNASIVTDGILPSLTYVPIRTRPNAQVKTETELAAEQASGEPEPHDTQQFANQQTSGARGGSQKRGAGARGDNQQPSARERGEDQQPARSRNDDQANTGQQGSGRRDPGNRLELAQQDTPADPHRPYTAWPGERDQAIGGLGEEQAFEQLQELLSGRHNAIAKKSRPRRNAVPEEPIDTSEVLAALSRTNEMRSPTGTPRSLPDIKQTLLAQARQKHGAGATLLREDSDTFDLLDMLYAQIQSEIRGDSAAAVLLLRLQLPLLRMALQDRAFFIRAQHPARELLNTVAESGARWLGDDDIDPQLLAPMKQAIDHVVKNFDGDPGVFEVSNSKLQAELHNLVHKAEVSERRHIEAARGKEKLEIAKLQAAETLAQMIGEQQLPSFVRALLNQAWADVLTLTLLRHGADSKRWQEQLDATGRIIQTCGPSKAPPDPGLAKHIETALSKVGYHADEAAEIARRLTSPLDDDEDDPASRTELANKLKTRTRLGEDAKEKPSPAPPPRNAEEQTRYEQLRVLPFGTWFEFVTNQQGDIVRRRLSWYSPVTDHSLFVNQRGKRVAEMTLDALSRMLVSGQARIVTAEHGRLVDRAWQATMNALRSLAGRGERSEAEDEAS